MSSRGARRSRGEDSGPSPASTPGPGARKKQPASLRALHFLLDKTHVLGYSRFVLLEVQSARGAQGASSASPSPTRKRTTNCRNGSATLWPWSDNVSKAENLLKTQGRKPVFCKTKLTTS